MFLFSERHLHFFKCFLQLHSPNSTDLLDPKTLHKSQGQLTFQMLGSELGYVQVMQNIGDVLSLAETQVDLKFANALRPHCWPFYDGVVISGANVIFLLCCIL